MNKNNTTFMFGVLFSSMVLLTIVQYAHAYPINTYFATRVQWHGGAGFDNGFAKAKHDVANSHQYNDSCSPSGAYCQNYKIGYETAWIQEHWSTAIPSNKTSVTINKTGSVRGIAHTTDGYTDGYNKGRSDTLNNHSFSDLCLSSGEYCDNYKRGYITGWVEMHGATGEPFDWKLLNANTTI